MPNTTAYDDFVLDRCGMQGGWCCAYCGCKYDKGLMNGTVAFRIKDQRRGPWRLYREDNGASRETGKHDIIPQGGQLFPYE